MDEHEQDKLEGLLRHALKNNSAPEGCPEPDLLAAYFERSLEAPEALPLEAHLSVCARCREELAVLARTEESAEETAEALAAAGQQPEFVEAPSPPLKRLWFWGVWAPAGATAVAVLIFWVVVKHRRLELASDRVERPAQVASYQAAPPAPSALPEKGAEPAPAPSAAEKATADKSSLGKKENETAVGREASPAPSVKRAAKPPARANQMLSAPMPPPSALVKKAEDEANNLEGVVGEAEGAPAAPPTKENAAAQKVGFPAVAENPSVAVETAPAPASAPSKLAPPPSNGESRAAMDQKSALVVGGRLANSYTLAVKPRSLAETVVIVPSGTTRIPTPQASSLWRIKSGRFVEFSGDSGRSWAATLTSVIQLLAGSAPSEQVCWIAGKQGMILRTKDHEHFQRIHPPIAADFTGVAAQDAETATVTASDGRKFSTQDGGRTWQPQP